MTPRFNPAKAALALLVVTAAACAAADDTLGPLSAKRAATASSSTSATVYVVHGINGTDLGAAESLPVDISVNGACALTAFPFRGIAGPLTLPQGTYDIEVRLASAANPCQGALTISASGVPLSGGSNVSIVAHLTAAGAPTASVFANDVTPVPGRARLVARHSADFGPVDVRVNGAVAFANVTNGVQGAALVRPGRQTVAILPAGTSVVAGEASLVPRPFTTYIAYAVGTPGNGTFEVLLQALPNN